MESPESSRHGRGSIWAEVSVGDDDDVAQVNVRDEHELRIDEPNWNIWGEDRAPCPGDYLTVGVVGCQVEVLKQCFEKARIEDYRIDARAGYTRHVSDEEAPGPFPDHTANQIASMEIELSVETTPEFEPRVKRCLEVCEDACIMGRSVRDGFDVLVSKELIVEQADQ